MGNDPIKVYRLRCGLKKHSAWLSSRQEVMAIALEKGLAYESIDGGPPGLGPLTWIEEGTRRYPRSRTIAKPPPSSIATRIEFTTLLVVWVIGLGLMIAQPFS